MPMGYDLVAVGIGGPQHVERGDARDVVLGRLPAEEHDEPDAVGSGQHGADAVKVSAA